MSVRWEPVAGLLAEVRAANAARVPSAAESPPGGAATPMVAARPLRITAVVLLVLNTLILAGVGGYGLLAPVVAALVSFPLWLCARRPMAAWWLTLAWLVALPPLTYLGTRMPVIPWMLDIAPVPVLVLYVAVLSAPSRAGVLAVCTGLLAGWAHAPYLAADAVLAVWSAGTWSAMLVMAALVGRTRRTRRDATLRVAAERQRVAEERGRRELLEERARIARELHDVVAHHMSVIAVQASSAPYRIEGGVSEPTAAEFAAIGAAARESLREMRQLLSVLRTAEGAAETAPQPGLADLGRLAESARRAGSPTRLTVDAPPERVSASVALSVYRIVQESLSNTVRHAPGASAEVSVDAHGDPPRLGVRVRNGPPPAAPAAAPDPAAVLDGRERGPGHGLLGMRERAAMLGGELAAGPTDDGGFLVTAIIPLVRDGDAGGSRVGGGAAAADGGAPDGSGAGTQAARWRGAGEGGGG
ncbi:sensor histidine kinase [Allonocardiopsis opalescens]|uniref:histidine kinase n=1 Tax=Allonocardiopsis opalescens TaxID=1144618 RepID=A0A2T0PX30_9ACTN|nr:histidine kinase [Allonocardiopsis opalescens]PRX96100.1 signal transduction histidine kinase [Allonocardiopsis opalescens]